VLVKNYDVMPKVIEFELLYLWNNVIAIVSLVEHTECQNKDRILGVDGDQIVIAALIHIDDIFAEIGLGG
jgi:hypothetical protein